MHLATPRNHRTVYLRSEHESGVHCNLVAVKTRVAPKKTKHTARTAIMSSDHPITLERERNNQRNITIWADSKTALHWIRNTEEYKVWGQNRVTEIRMFTSTETWRYCPTKFNPADVASRGALAVQLINDDNWWHRPRFLLIPEELWPVQPIKEPENNSDYYSLYYIPVFSLVKGLQSADNYAYFGADKINLVSSKVKF